MKSFREVVRQAVSTATTFSNMLRSVMNPLWMRGAQEATAGSRRTRKQLAKTFPSVLEPERGRVAEAERTTERGVSSSSDPFREDPQEGDVEVIGTLSVFHPSAVRLVENLKNGAGREAPTRIQDAVRARGRLTTVFNQVSKLIETQKNNSRCQGTVDCSEIRNDE